MSSSNLDQVEEWLEELEHLIDFDAPGATGGTFGDELLDVYSEHVRERSIGAAKAPDGSNWADNAESTKRRKTTSTVGVESGQMLSLEEIEGERVITRDSAEQTYGKTPEAQAKLQWFTRGSKENPPPEDVPDCSPSGASNQPGRPAWGMDDLIEEDIAERVARRLERMAQEWGR